jgi:hypothetical protein
VVRQVLFPAVRRFGALGQIVEQIRCLVCHHWAFEIEAEVVLVRLAIDSEEVLKLLIARLGDKRRDIVLGVEGAYRFKVGGAGDAVAQVNLDDPLNRQLRRHAARVHLSWKCRGLPACSCASKPLFASDYPSAQGDFDPCTASQKTFSGFAPLIKSTWTVIFANQRTVVHCKGQRESNPPARSR